MRIIEHKSGITFQDKPVLIWLPVAIFAAVGVGFTGIGVQEAMRGAPAFSSSGALGVGFVALGVAVWIASHAEHITIDFDAVTRRITSYGWWLWRTRKQEWSFADIADIEVEEKDAGDDERMWRPVIVLVDGHQIPMMALSSHDEEMVLNVRKHAQALLKT